MASKRSRTQPFNPPISASSTRAQIQALPLAMFRLCLYHGSHTNQRYRSVFPGRLCTLCGLWCMADSAPHTPCGLWCMADSAPHTPRLALAPPLPMVQIGYTPPTRRFSVYTTRASPSWCICTKPTRGHSVTYIWTTSTCSMVVEKRL